MENIKIENFIMEYDDFVTKQYCDDVIEYFEDLNKCGFTKNRIEAENRSRIDIDDTNIIIHANQIAKLNASQDLNSVFLDKFWGFAYKEYANKYSILSKIEEHKIFYTKIQRAEVGEGFHAWHTEAASRMYNCRILTYVLYLNDVDEGGETEFLYYPKRVKPKTGKLLLFPAGITHVHRGNPPISNTKYIITGWVEF